MLQVVLRNLFTPKTVAQQLKELPPIESVVMDTYYTSRPGHPFPVIGVDDIVEAAQVIPVTRRGAPSHSITAEGKSITYIEPLPIRPSITLTAKDLSDLRLLGDLGKEAWAKASTDRLRKTTHLTTEALSGQSLTGAISHPVELAGGGWDIYSVSYGSPQSYTPIKLWDDAEAKVMDVFICLRGMKKKLRQKGWGSKIEIWAGETAYNTLFGLVQGFISTAEMKVQITEEGINIGGFLVKPADEEYLHPQTGASVPVVGEDQVVMFSTAASQKLFYCAVDDLDANLLALPFFVKAIKQDDPSGFKLVAECKPLPAPNIKAICWATVLGGGE